GAQAPAPAAARSAARRNDLPDSRRLSARDARPCRPVCRSPASAHRDTAAASPSLPVPWRNRYHGPSMNDSDHHKRDRRSWWQRLSGGLTRSSAALGGAIANLVSKRKLDSVMVGEIEDV